MPKAPSIGSYTSDPKLGRRFKPQSISVPSGAGGFATPLSLGSSLIAWYDTTKLGLSNGANVAAWADAGPAANDGVTFAGTKTYTTNAQNSLPGVLFAGGDNNYFLRNSWTGGATSTTWYWFLALKVVAVPGAANATFLDTRTGTSGSLGIALTTGDLLVRSQAAYVDTSSALTTTAYVITFKSATGANGQAWVNGTSVWTGTPGGGTNNGFIMGQSAAGTGGANFYWLEGFLANGDQSGVRSQAESYLRGKWAI